MSVSASVAVPVAYVPSSPGPSPAGLAAGSVSESLPPFTLEPTTNQVIRSNAGAGVNPTQLGNNDSKLNKTIRYISSASQAILNVSTFAVSSFEREKISKAYYSVYESIVESGQTQWNEICGPSVLCSNVTAICQKTCTNAVNNIYAALSQYSRENNHLSDLVVPGAITAVASAAISVLNYKVLSSTTSSRTLYQVAGINAACATLFFTSAGIIPAAMTLAKPLMVASGVASSVMGITLGIKGAGGPRALCAKVANCFMNCFS